ncbi:uncharacterized protein METZ01_LOCUS240833 [marine metagenome]|uniref:Uncharacterized protein n=1 Tax=marine metagenome TaxID=408172 RepID=A0A382HL97_9ZZZZ
MIRDKDIEGRIKRGKKSQLKTHKEIKVYQRFETPANNFNVSELDVKSLPLSEREMEILRKQGKVVKCPYHGPQES